MDARTRQFLNGILGAAPAEMVVSTFANMDFETQFAGIDHILELVDGLSQNLRDMLHTRRLEEKPLTEKQVAWFIRELRS